jgi:catechol 2,3-dioxygenase-like lactoylglutathione lyase family enzyme
VAGAVDICFLSSITVENWCKRFEEFSVSIEEEPVSKTGAMGSLWSIYVRDPDGNLIEISNQKT